MLYVFFIYLFTKRKKNSLSENWVKLNKQILHFAEHIISITVHNNCIHFSSKNQLICVMEELLA